MSCKQLKKVMLLEKYPNSINYRFGCDCIDPGCDLHIDFEFDKEHMNMVWVTFYKNMRYADWWGIGYSHWWLWFSRMRRRLLGVLKLLFRGEMELEEEMVIMGEEHIDSLIQLLKDGKEYCLTPKEATSSSIIREGVIKS